MSNVNSFLEFDSSISLTILIPLHNKEENIKYTVDQILSYLKLTNLQIVIIENDSTDNSYKVAEQLVEKYKLKHDIRLITSKKGLGNAIKEGFKHIKHDWIWFCPADFSFKFSDLEYVFKNNLFHDYDLFIGSKSHKDAKVKRKISRELYSNFFNLILKFLFKTSFKDTQGTFILKKASLEKIDKIISNEFFVSTEIVIRFNKSKMKILEIPLTDFGIETVSTVSPLKDGFKMLIQAIKLKKIINKK